MILKTKLLALAGMASIVAPMALIGVSHGSDHADTPEIAATPGADITDVYAFQAPDSANNVVLSMNVHPLIGPGNGPSTTFDPNVLYQFKFDGNGDGLEDLVMQVKFDNATPQNFYMVGPVAPAQVGGHNTLVSNFNNIAMSGPINTVVNSGGYKIFCGAREDPFFFDLEQFFNILPDRATPLNGVAVSNPNAPQQGSFRPVGQAVDFLSNGQYNVLSIIVEMPKSAFGQYSANTIGMWTTTGELSGGYYNQLDRLARPVVNEVFATVANGRHKINDLDQPLDDSEELASDIQGFMTYPAGRSAAITNVVSAVLVPDVMKFNLPGTKTGYLGVETMGTANGVFGGRALTNDVVDLSLSIVFGNKIPALGLAPDDGKEIKGLETDNVGDGGKHFLSAFPYMGNPR